MKEEDSIPLESAGHEENERKEESEEEEETEEEGLREKYEISMREAGGTVERRSVKLLNKSGGDSQWNAMQYNLLAVPVKHRGSYEEKGCLAYSERKKYQLAVHAEEKYQKISTTSNEIWRDWNWRNLQKAEIFDSIHSVYRRKHDLRLCDHVKLADIQILLYSLQRENGRKEEGRHFLLAPEVEIWWLWEKPYSRRWLGWRGYIH